MKTATIRDLRHNTNKLLDWVEQGECVEVQRRGVPVATVAPLPPVSIERPDFEARLRAIYGDTALEVTGTELIAQARGDR